MKILLWRDERICQSKSMLKIKFSTREESPPRVSMEKYFKIRRAALTGKYWIQMLPAYLLKKQINSSHGKHFLQVQRL